MKKIKIIILLQSILLFILINSISGQDKKEKIGLEEIAKNGVNYYNYADKEKVNFEVSVWGFVKNPGRYLIPADTRFLDLITLCGGPLVESKMDDVRLLRMKNDSLNINEDKIIYLNYSDFLGEEKFTSNNRQNPILYPGDMILIPGISKSALRENLMFILSILGTLTSIAVLIVTVFKK